MKMQKQLLFRWIRILFFFASVPGLYFLWEYGGAQWVMDAVHPHSTVNSVRLGTQAPNFAIPKDRIWSKKDFEMHQLKGVPVILHFWATWCGPCLQELPELLKLSDKLRPEGYSIVAVAVDESWAVLENFFARYPHLSSMKDRMVLVLDPEGKIANAYGSSRFPETFLINTQMVIDNKLIGAQPWNESVMTPYLKNLKPEAKD